MYVVRDLFKLQSYACNNPYFNVQFISRMLIVADNLILLKRSVIIWLVHSPAVLKDLDNLIYSNHNLNQSLIVNLN